MPLLALLAWRCSRRRPIAASRLQPPRWLPCTDKELQTHDPILGKALEILRAKIEKPN